MCEFHDCNCNGLGDIWWTDKCMYFSSTDMREKTTVTVVLSYWLVKPVEESIQQHYQDAKK